MEYYYLDISIILSEEVEKILPIFFLGSIEYSLKSIFGEIGGQTTLDLLKFDQKSRKAILRVPSDFYVKTRAAITLISKFQDIICHFKVNSASPSLLSLLDSNLDFD